MGAILTAACGRGERRLQLLFYAFFALLVFGLARLKPGGGQILVAVLALPTAFLWIGWFSRLLLLQAHGDMLRVPGLPKAVTRTLLAMALLTVLLPALLLSITGPTVLFATSVLACAAAAGLLFALLPRGLAAFAGFLPMLVSVTGASSLAWVLGTDAALPLLALLLVLLAGWRWLRIFADIGRWSEPDWRQPMVFAMGRRNSIFGASDLFDPKVQQGMIPRWLRHGVDMRDYRPGEVRMVRALLGGVFAPMGWKQLLATCAMYLLVLALLLRYFDHDGESPWQMLLFFGLFTGGILLVTPFARRLQGLQRNHGSAMAELALLPGWGGATRARAALVRAVARVFARTALVMLALMAFAAAMTGNPEIVLLAIASTLAMVALGVVAWLRPLAGYAWRLNAWIGALLVLVGVPLLGCTVAAFGGGTLLPPMILAWSLLLLAALWPAFRSWQAFQRRPQPFLMY